MADVVVNSDVFAITWQRDGLHGPFWTSTSVGYVVLQRALGPFAVYKTDDSGATWSGQDSINNPAEGDNRSSAVWFDQETPGNSGTLIHLAWVQSVAEECHYITFDTANDTWGTDRIVDALTISSASASSDVGITVSTSGRVYVAARGSFSQDTENTDHSMRSSSDGFATNNESELSPYSSDEEVVKLLPGADADEDDICAVVYDVINQDLEFWKFDASANSWGVTAIDAGMSLTGAEARSYKGGFDAAIRHSDEHILVVYWTDLDAATADFKCADITQATPTVTGKTNLDTDTDDSFLAAIHINQQNDDVRVAYIGSDVGDEVWTSAVRVYSKLSADGMGSWGAEQAYGVQNDDLKVVSAGHSVGDAGGRFMPVWFNDDLDDVLVNDGNDVEIAALSIGAFFETVLGNMPTASGIINRGKEILGNLPNQTSVIIREAAKIIIGVLPIQTGTIIRGLAILGNMPFSTAGINPLEQYILNILDNVAGYWSMGEASGDAIDHSGNGNDGTVTLGTGTRDETALNHMGDGSILFDGANTVVTIPDDAAIQNIWAGGGSAFFIFNADSDGKNSIARIISKGALATDITLRAEAGGLVGLDFIWAFSGDDGNWQTSVNIPINTKIIGVWTYNTDSASNNPILYLWDGSTFSIRTVGDGLIEEMVPTGTRSSDVGDDLIIGNTSINNATFDGHVDEIALFSDILTQDEAREIINRALRKSLFWEIVLGVVPFATGVALRGKTLLGNIPFPTGIVTTILNGGQLILGSMPSPSGVVTTLYGIKLFGNLPTQAGVIVRAATKTMIGTMPQQTSVIVRKIGKVLSGTVPFATGVIFRGITILGNLPQQTGTVLKGFVIELTGDLPPQTGVVIRKVGKVIAGIMPNPTGIILRGKEILGNIPAQSGTLVRGKLTAFRTIVGNMPQISGLLVGLVEAAGSYFMKLRRKRTRD